MFIVLNESLVHSTSIPVTPYLTKSNLTARMLLHCPSTSSTLSMLKLLPRWSLWIRSTQKLESYLRLWMALGISKNGIQNILTHYDLPAGCWLKVMYLGRSNFYINVKNLDLQEIEYPTPRVEIDVPLM